MDCVRASSPKSPRAARCGCSRCNSRGGPDGILLSVENQTDQFDALQAKLVPLWKSIRGMNQDPQTIVIVPSINVDAGLSSVRQQALEERFLFLLLLLRQPRARVIYVTSHQIHPDVLDY